MKREVGDGPMRLLPNAVSGWPRLAWCAQASSGEPVVVLHHGALVEVRDGWGVEGVWDRPFAEGDFDRTSLFFGSGVRCRGDDVQFVSSGSLSDRLWFYEEDGELWVSNSLPVLLASAELSLRDDFPFYARDTANAVERFRSPSPAFVPTSRQDLGLIYYHNLRFDGRRLRAVAKPVDAPPFTRFEAYRAFLSRAARRIGRNAADGARAQPIVPLTTISSGYDSPAASVIAREAGCSKAVTIRAARSVVPRPDSGLAIADHLGIECSVHDRHGREHPWELAFWAAVGSLQDSNLAVFAYPEPLCLLFTGVFGGRIWNTEGPDYHLGADTNGLGFCEFRLIQGVIHCPVPFWGWMRAAELFELGISDEMEPWRTWNGYDRPIPRRMVEEAGAPRDAFAVRKSATSFSESFLWPYAPELSRDYADYVRARRGARPPVPLLRLANWLDQNLLLPIEKRLHQPIPILSRLRGSSGLTFQWSNHRLRDLFGAPRDAGGASGVG